MNLRLLGLLGMVGAPGLAVALLLGSDPPQTYAVRMASAAFSTLYLLGWMASIQGLRQLRAVGGSVWGELLLKSQFFTLPIAMVFNFYEAIAPKADTPLYHATNLCWPLSNVVILAIAILIIAEKKLPGWKRFVPLACGLWLPAMMLWVPLFGEKSVFVIALHSAVAWWCLGMTVFTTDIPQRENLPEVAPETL